MHKFSTIKNKKATMYMTNHYCYCTNMLCITTNFVFCGEFSSLGDKKLGLCLIQKIFYPKKNHPKSMYIKDFFFNMVDLNHKA